MAWTQSTPRQHLPSKMKVSPESPGRLPRQSWVLTSSQSQLWTLFQPPLSLLALSPQDLRDLAAAFCSSCQVPLPLTKEKEK